MQILTNIHSPEILGRIWISMWIIGMLPYFRDMYAGTTKPHIFSWLVRGVLTGIAFAGQLVDGGGLWSWVTGIGSVFCFIVVAYATTHGWTSYITRADRYALAWSAIAGLIRRRTETPLWSMLLVTSIDILWFIPTLRKGRINPYSETIITYTISWLKYIFAIAALAHISIITTLYPASLIFLNCGFALMLWWRRKQILPK